MNFIRRFFRVDPSQLVELRTLRAIQELHYHYRDDMDGNAIDPLYWAFTNSGAGGETCNRGNYRNGENVLLTGVIINNWCRLGGQLQLYFVELAPIFECYLALATMTQDAYWGYENIGGDQIWFWWDGAGTGTLHCQVNDGGAIHDYDTGIVLGNGTWYYFRIEVLTTNDALFYYKALTADAWTLLYDTRTDAGSGRAGSNAALEHFFYLRTTAGVQSSMGIDYCDEKQMRRA